MKKALVVEDRASFAPNLRKGLEGRGVASAWLPHGRVASETATALAELDLIFLDAYDIGSQQADPSCSRLGALAVMEVVRAIPDADRPPVIVYSTHMTRPEINIPMREWGIATACFEAVDLLPNMDAVLAGDFGGQVATPTPDDWKALHPRLPVGARVADAHQLAQTHEQTWNAICDPAAPFSRAAQRWTTRRLLPLLGIERGYTVAIQVIQRIACLPSAFAV